MVLNLLDISGMIDHRQIDSNARAGFEVKGALGSFDRIERWVFIHELVVWDGF